MTIKIGDKFGKWTVLEQSTTDKNNKRRFPCKCDCGRTAEVVAGNLVAGVSRSCGFCARKNGSYQQLTDQQKMEIVNRYLSNESSKSLGDEFNISSGTVLNFVKRAGHTVRSIAQHNALMVTRRTPGLAAKNAKFKYYKAQAKFRGYPFELNKGQFIEATSQNCHYCNGQPSNEAKAASGSYLYNGLDRIDPSKGYTVTNIVPCCIICNRAKSDMTINQFDDWIDRLIKQRKET